MSGCSLIPATLDSTLGQRDRAKCALYQFNQSLTGQEFMMRDLGKNGDLYHYAALIRNSKKYCLLLEM